MSGARSGWLAPVGAALVLVLMAALAFTGRWPGHAALSTFKPDGILKVKRAQVTSVEVTDSAGTVLFHRDDSGWRAGGRPAVGGHVDTALHFLEVSKPLRRLPAESVTVLSQFGLDPPQRTVVLSSDTSELARVAFGISNPADTSQYVQVAGQPGVFLLARHVGEEWALAVDRARRLSETGAPLLLPVSINRIWAVEIVAGGAVTRFERDSKGLWFHHVGQHVHVGPADAHIADPALAPKIAAELDRLDGATVEQVAARDPDADTLARYDLARPTLVALFYARDNSEAVMRLDLGAVAGGRRYARVRDEQAVVLIPNTEAEPLDSLLRVAGARS
jgi:hypothetical protein